ncbi:MAG TPA: acetate--CoA ligase [Longimicrobiales bacterium]|nr:acetate--CoA ligase [Longimicrobiales bacterium]
MREFSLGRIAGVEIRVDASWFVLVFLVLWSFALVVFPASYGGLSVAAYLAMGLAATLLLLASLLAHELAHALAARAERIPVDAIRLFIFGGVTRTRTEARTPGRELVLAVVGPVASLAVALLFSLLWMFLGARGNLPAAAVVARHLAVVNLVLAVFNLLPGLPLDGGRMLRALLWKLSGDPAQATRIASRAGLLLAYVLLATGLVEALRGDVVGGIWIFLIAALLRNAAAASLERPRPTAFAAGVPAADAPAGPPAPDRAAARDAAPGGGRPRDAAPEGATPSSAATTMGRETIRKPRGGWAVTPNLVDYEQACRDFSWDAAARELAGLPGGAGLNIAHEAVDRHAAGPLADRVALRFLGRSGTRRDITFAELRALTNRFANVLRALGIGPGERVFSLMERVPELYIAALGTLKNRSVFCPLFSAFGPEPIQARLALGDARALVTTAALYRRKVAKLRAALPLLQHVLLADAPAEGLAGTLDLRRLTAAADERFDIPPTDPEEPALLHFTSGTTGQPKGAVHVHRAVVAHHATGRLVLDLHPEDIFWCTADPGWVTGTSYGIVSPLSNGVTSIVDEADFDAERWYRILQDERVTVWYTAPTAIRMLMKAGDELPRRYDLSRLRFVASVGEPLNPEAVVWGRDALGRPIHDNWWQTETGGIMIANFAAMDIRPGSMGRALPGIEAAVVRRTGEDTVEELGPAEEGELALRPGWPSMFRAYLHDEERYRRCFAGGWYLTGDLARRDADGYLWFVGRADDVIKSMGHLIGPFEVESALLEHPGVAEAGVIGKPDPVAGELVKAFVALKPGVVASDELRLELLGFARQRLGAVVAPKEIEFLGGLPKNRAGKIMRRLLKARELGLPEGDTSTVWSPP